MNMRPHDDMPVRRPARAMLLAILLAASAAPAIPAALHAQDPRDDRIARARQRAMAMRDSDDRGRQRIDTTVTIGSSPTVELSLISGEMRVSTWNRPEARVVAQITSGSLDFDASDSHLELSPHDEGRGRNEVGSATYEVTLPVNARLTLEAVSGSITVTGARGPAEVSSVSGGVTVRGSGRTLSVETVSGAVEVTDAGGDVRANTVSGVISIRNVPGVVEAEAVSGGISIAGAHGERVRTETVSGGTDFSGTFSPTGRYSFETHSGRVTLHIPATTAADLSVETFSGTVVNEVPGAVRRPESDPDDESTNYHYVLGRGGAKVSIDTFSGRVTITTTGAQ